METIKIKFAELRKHTQDVYDMVGPMEAVCGKMDQNSKIYEDLGLWGDDNYFLLVEFIEKYKVDFDGFDYSKHFEDEGSMGIGCVLNLISLPFYVVKFVLREATRPFFPILSEKISEFWMLEKHEPKLDLTIADLIVSKARGKFGYRVDYRFELT